MQQGVIKKVGHLFFASKVNNVSRYIPGTMGSMSKKNRGTQKHDANDPMQ